jgi:two-component system, NarL family, nitrate/nitrite response regulator NarL
VGRSVRPDRGPSVKVVRVTIADDHAIVREGLRALFEVTPDIAVAGEVERADELTPTVTKTRCDVLVLDLQMDRWMMDDIPDLAQLTKVVVLTGSDREHDLLDALRLGARAIVKKTFAAETIREAIRAAVTGAVWMPADLRDKLTAKSPAEGAAGLSARESDIARYVAVGMRNAEVARKLGITEGTVKVHLNNIYKKLQIRDRVELTLYAIRNRLIGTRGAS